MGLQIKMQDSEPDEYKQDMHCYHISSVLKPHRLEHGLVPLSPHKPDRIAALKSSLCVLWPVLAGLVCPEWEPLGG